MGPKTKFWTRQVLAGCAYSAGFWLATRIGFSEIGAFMVGAAAGISVTILLWPNNIQGEVVSNAERNSSRFWSFLIMGLCFAVVLLMTWAFAHLQAKREARSSQEPPGISIDLDSRSDRDQ